MWQDHLKLQGLKSLLPANPLRTQLGFSQEIELWNQFDYFEKLAQKPEFWNKENFYKIEFPMDEL